MADRYFVLTGVKRSGTKFLASVLNQHPDSEVRHEPFFPPERGNDYRCWPEAFESWAAIEAPVVGMVSCYATSYVREINKAVSPYWGFLWREPLDLTTSIAGHSGNRTVDFLDREGVSNLDKLLSHVEACLATLEEASIPVEHWAFADYTQPEGFARLAVRLGLGGEFNLQQGSRNTRHGSCPSPDEWPRPLRDRVVGIVNNLPRVRAGYEAAGVGVG